MLKMVNKFYQKHKERFQKEGSKNIKICLTNKKIKGKHK